MDTAPTLSAMDHQDTDAIVSLIGRAMNPQEAQYAHTSFKRHFATSGAGVHDGRHYFVAREAGRIVGFTGLHHWAWGPDENVWLGWFAVEPDRQGAGIGAWLLARTELKARELGFRKLYVETYDHQDFKRAITFYKAKGFKHAGRIDSWMPGGEAMIVLVKEL